MSLQPTISLLSGVVRWQGSAADLQSGTGTQNENLRFLAAVIYALDGDQSDMPSDVVVPRNSEWFPPGVNGSKFPRAVRRKRTQNWQPEFTGLERDGWIELGEQTISLRRLDEIDLFRFRRAARHLGQAWSHADELVAAHEVLRVWQAAHQPASPGQIELDGHANRVKAYIDHAYDLRRADLHRIVDRALDVVEALEGTGARQVYAGQMTELVYRPGDGQPSLLTPARRWPDEQLGEAIAAVYDSAAERDRNKDLPQPRYTVSDARRSDGLREVGEQLFWDNVVEGRDVMITGIQGIGKTTALKRLNDQLARAYLCGRTDRLPIFASLSDWSEGESPWAWMAKVLRKRYRLSGDDAAALVDTYHLVLLVDGLDEVPKPDRTACARSLRELRKRHPTVQICVSCRETVDPDPWQLADEMEVDVVARLDLPEEDVAAWLSARFGPALASRLGELPSTTFVLHMLTAIDSDAIDREPSLQNVTDRYLAELLDLRVEMDTREQRRHLVWLARDVVEAPESAKAIRPEWLSPSWAPPTARRTVTLRRDLLAGLTAGGTFALAVSLAVLTRILLRSGRFSSWDWIPVLGCSALAVGFVMFVRWAHHQPSGTQPMRKVRVTGASVRRHARAGVEQFTIAWVLSAATIWVAAASYGLWRPDSAPPNDRSAALVFATIVAGAFTVGTLADEQPVSCEQATDIVAMRWTGFRAYLRFGLVAGLVVAVPTAMFDFQGYRAERAPLDATLEGVGATFAVTLFLVVVGAVAIGAFPALSAGVSARTLKRLDHMPEDFSAFLDGAVQNGLLVRVDCTAFEFPNEVVREHIATSWAVDRPLDVEDGAFRRDT